jgi:hypothetical protein
VRRAAALAVLLLACACSKGPAPSPAPGAPGAPTGPAPVAASGPGAQADTPAGGAWLVTATALRREPVDAQRVAGPGGKQVSNYVTTLQRAERVTVVEGRGEWAQVRTSGDEPGWLRRTTLLEAEGSSVATLLVAADVFDRPDLLAANARRKLDPGSLLLVVRQRPPFAEVNAGPGPVVWVLADRLVPDERAVSTAKLVEKARWLKRSGKEDEARQILELGRGTFGPSPLLDLLATELGVAPAGAAAPSGPDGAAAPVSPPEGTPAPPPGPGEAVNPR